MAPTHALGENVGSVSVIIPVLRDLPALQRLLAQLASQSPVPCEVIVVDGTGDATSPAEQACAVAGARWLRSPPGRGQQLRAGAEQARGEILWFLHADATIPGNAIAAIEAAVRHGTHSGYFRFRFAGRRTATKRFLEWWIAWRCRVATVYGDQGLFVTRDAYRQSGGFAATPLFEEAPLVASLRRQGGFAGLTEAIEVDTRRWERRGYWRQTLLNRALALGYMLGVSPERLAGWYRRGG